MVPKNNAKKIENSVHFEQEGLLIEWPDLGGAEFINVLLYENNDQE